MTRILTSYCAKVGKGYGAAWRGIIFCANLQTAIAAIKQLLEGSGARYDVARQTWFFPDGERLSLRTYQKPSDYWKYHGLAFPFIGWSEVPRDPRMDHINRSGVPLKIEEQL